jgi:hypothetical protein
MHFYLGDYPRAIADFEASIKSKQDQKDSDNSDANNANDAQS